MTAHVAGRWRLKWMARCPPHPARARALRCTTSAPTKLSTSVDARVPLATDRGCRDAEMPEAGTNPTGASRKTERGREQESGGGGLLGQTRRPQQRRLPRGRRQRQRPPGLTPPLELLGGDVAQVQQSGQLLHRLIECVHVGGEGGCSGGRRCEPARQQGRRKDRKGGGQYMAAGRKAAGMNPSQLGQKRIGQPVKGWCQ